MSCESQAFPGQPEWISTSSSILLFYTYWKVKRFNRYSHFVLNLAVSTFLTHLFPSQLFPMNGSSGIPKALRKFLSTWDGDSVLLVVTAGIPLHFGWHKSSAWLTLVGLAARDGLGKLASEFDLPMAFVYRWLPLMFAVLYLFFFVAR